MKPPTTMPDARHVAQALADRVGHLARELLPNGHYEGAEWRCGSIAGEPGHSLAVHLSGERAGVWADFATGHRGDALDLVRAVLRLNMSDALAWSSRWLGIVPDAAELPAQRPQRTNNNAATDPSRWSRPWRVSEPISGTTADRYLSARGLTYHDPHGEVLRYMRQRWRRHPESGMLEHHPALLALLRDILTGKPCGILNIFLRPDGTGRLRDPKGKTVSGRAGGAAIMLTAWDELTSGLTIAEGVESAMAVLQSGLAPVWALGGAGNLATLPLLPGVEALSIAADADNAGRQAADAVAERWRSAGCEVVIIAPPVGDWADPQRAPV